MIYDALGIEVTQAEADFAAMVVTLGRHTGKHNTMNLAKRCIDQDIAGDFVECGVNAGGHPALMAYIAKKYEPYGARKVHLYDSFEGVPTCGPEDPREWREITGVNPDPSKPVAAGRIVNPLAGVKENMRKWGAREEQLVYHVGWLQYVLPKPEERPAAIALLRIDVDLYDSTLPVMEHLYPLVTSGGYIISDDWGENEAMVPCRLAMFRYFDAHGIAHPTVTRIPETPGTAWWRKP